MMLKNKISMILINFKKRFNYNFNLNLRSEIKLELLEIKNYLKKEEKIIITQYIPLSNTLVMVL